MNLNVWMSGISNKILEKPTYAIGDLNIFLIKLLYYYYLFLILTYRDSNPKIGDILINIAPFFKVTFVFYYLPFLFLIRTLHIPPKCYDYFLIINCLWITR